MIVHTIIRLSHPFEVIATILRNTEEFGFRVYDVKGGVMEIHGNFYFQ